MKIGIVVHSITGNTLSVAQKIKEELSADGHTISLEQVAAVDEKQAQKGKVQLKDIPDVSAYDILIFGAPVHAFSLSQVMKAFLTNAELSRDKKVFCYVTQSFPFSWLGGNRAIRQMREICESKGSTVIGTGVVMWKRLNRRKQIDDLAKKVKNLVV